MVCVGVEIRHGIVTCGVRIGAPPGGAYRSGSDPRILRAGQTAQDHRRSWHVEGPAEQVSRPPPVRSTASRASSAALSPISPGFRLWRVKKERTL
jgi:hypothetical protein